MPNAPNSHDTCPADAGETAESYVMKRLSLAAATQFAIHCLTCRQCAAAAQEAHGYIRALKAAAGRWKAGPHERPRLCSHANYISVTPLPLGGLRVRMRFEVAVRG